MGAPSLIAEQSVTILGLMNALNTYENNKVMGAIVANGGTTQGSGASGALNYDVDTTEILEARVDGEFHVLAAQTDADATAGAGLDFGATSGKSVVFAVVLETGADNDTPAIHAQYGTVAATGAEQPPSDDDIDTALGHTNWVRVCNHTVNRTADTTVTHAYDHSVRPSMSAWNSRVLAETEAELQS